MNVRVVPDTLSPEIGPDTDMAVRRALRGALGEEIATSWFGRLQIDRILGSRAVVSQPTTFLRSWTLAHYAEAMLDAVRTIAPQVDKVEVVLRSSAARVALRPQLVAQPAVAIPAPKPAPTISFESGEEGDVFIGSSLDARMTFETFHTGRGNELAHAAAQKVVEAGADQTPVFNPLYIHGAVGLGKTHLLQAVAHAVSAQRRRVIYLTAEKFMYGFVLALKAQTSLAFKEQLRGIDVLIIDDVQFLQGKAIGAEFGRVIDAMLDARKQIVVAADRPPSHLEVLDDRIRSRLAGGLVAEIGAPDLEVRTRILEMRVAAARRTMPGFDVGPEIIAAVAGLIQTNGRDLDGAVNRLMAHASLTQAPLTVETAEVAIRDLVRTREPKRVRIEDVQALVATHYNVSRIDLVSSRRTANVVRPRQIAMYLAKVLTLRSLPEIGRRFGGRDHTTVIHAVRRITDLAGCDCEFRDELAGLKMLLEG